MNYKKALKATANKYKVSVSTVINEIQSSIDKLYNSSDPSIRSKWRAICKDGSKPTVEQLLEYLDCNNDDNTQTDNHRRLS